MSKKKVVSINKVAQSEEEARYLCEAAIYVHLNELIEEHDVHRHYIIGMLESIKMAYQLAEEEE